MKRLVVDDDSDLAADLAALKAAQDKILRRTTPNTAQLAALKAAQDKMRAVLYEMKEE